MRHYSKAELSTAYVEVVCGIDHGSIFIPYKSRYKQGGWVCRYARGDVTHRASGLIIRKHACHLCNCQWAMPALTPPDERVCDNCGGPAVPVGTASSAPGILVLKDFPDADGNAESAALERGPRPVHA